jgi:hypothetical protein
MTPKEQMLEEIRRKMYIQSTDKEFTFEDMETRTAEACAAICQVECLKAQIEILQIYKDAKPTRIQYAIQELETQLKQIQG